jgi:hypothetical protein
MFLGISRNNNIKKEAPNVGNSKENLEEELKIVCGAFEDYSRNLSLSLESLSLTKVYDLDFKGSKIVLVLLP